VHGARLHGEVEHRRAARLHLLDEGDLGVNLCPVELGDVGAARPELARVEVASAEAKAFDLSICAVTITVTLLGLGTCRGRCRRRGRILADLRVAAVDEVDRQVLGLFILSSVDPEGNLELVGFGSASTFSLGSTSTTVPMKTRWLVPVLPAS